MLKKLINIVVFVPLGVILVILSVANRQTVTLALNPFDPADSVLSVSAPFFVFLFLAAIVGLILGAAVTWFTQGKHRRRARNEANEAQKWHREAEKQRSEAEKLAQTTLPAPQN
ncbi:Permeases of the major facilitator superfamily [Sinorhizobium sojae CCBAU 05684]|uniref:Permeases of the major facilitator superfamily n=1 Tax=Sinorhizobium sojae CCBAU 05684 TaxID=716928 RepID=A0A249P6F9_9HYPH|nr:lipopolysaccharide assembly protein LapA domain-containing protein [Sinorhizobium sojae]ASY61493.1 Permeases of the major facilitator superfamily [Sinorhizobium sojae CCBAU 05684]